MSMERLMPQEYALPVASNDPVRRDLSIAPTPVDRHSDSCQLCGLLDARSTAPIAAPTTMPIVMPTPIAKLPPITAPTTVPITMPIPTGNPINFIPSTTLSLVRDPSTSTPLDCQVMVNTPASLVPLNVIG